MFLNTKISPTTVCAFITSCGSSCEQNTFVNCQYPKIEVDNCAAGLDQLWRSWGRQLRHQTGEEKAAAYLIQRLSIAVQQGNAVSILGECRQSALPLNRRIMLMLFYCIMYSSMFIVYEFSTITKYGLETSPNFLTSVCWTLPVLIFKLFISSSKQWNPGLACMWSLRLTSRGSAQYYIGNTAFS